MSEYLKTLTEAFEKFPVGTRVTGRDRLNAVETGFIAPGGFGVVTAQDAVNFGRAWVTIDLAAPDRTASGPFSKFNRKVWVDTLVATPEPEPEPRGVVAHLLVEVAFKRGAAGHGDALQLADNLVDAKLNGADSVERFYIRQLGTANADN